MHLCVASVKANPNGQSFKYTVTVKGRERVSSLVMVLKKYCSGVSLKLTFLSVCMVLIEKLKFSQEALSLVCETWKAPSVSFYGDSMYARIAPGTTP